MQTYLLRITITLAITLLTTGAGWAGSLDPSAPPGPTMKTLDEIPPTWSQALPADDADANDGCGSSRFDCVIGGEAVLDKETGLVWWRSPQGNTVAAWSAARRACTTSSSGGKKGWRLPSIHELASLMIPGEFLPTIPPDHPFIGFPDGVSPNDLVWSVTQSVDKSAEAWAGNFNNASEFEKPKSEEARFWCVRGGSPGPGTY